MRRFTVLAPGSTEDEQLVWEGAGFVLFRNETECMEQPDLVFWSGMREQSGTLWQTVTRTLPKLFVAVSGQAHTLPEHLSGIYELRQLAEKGIHVTTGSRLQEPLAAPDRLVCCGDGSQDQKESIKTFAATVYRFLLQDVFRETAEWCGHMSSVVGPS